MPPTCRHCSDHITNDCAACLNETFCTECVGGLFLSADSMSCGAFCDPEEFEDAGFPKVCHYCRETMPGCMDCSDSTTCNECYNLATPFLAPGSVCVADCADDFHEDYFGSDVGLKECVECDASIITECKECSDSNTCTKCHTSSTSSDMIDYYLALASAECVPNCTVDYHSSSFNDDTATPPACTMCNDAFDEDCEEFNANGCFKCAAGYYLVLITLKRHPPPRLFEL